MPLNWLGSAVMIMVWLWQAGRGRGVEENACQLGLCACSDQVLRCVTKDTISSLPIPSGEPPWTNIKEMSV